MKTILLDSRPISGEYEEEWFDAVGECVSVLFEDDNYMEWLGVFGRADIVEFDEVIPFPNCSSAMVISGGQGYVIDVNSRKLAYRTQCNFLSGVIAIPERDLIIGSQFTKLYAYSSSEELWESESIALDGIRLEEASPAGVSGRVWKHDGWHSFKLYVDDWAVVVNPTTIDERENAG